MESYELEELTDGRYYNEIIDLLEPDPLLLQTYYYYRHCTYTMRRLQKEMEEQ